MCALASAVRPAAANPPNSAKATFIRQSQTALERDLGGQICAASLFFECVRNWPPSFSSSLACWLVSMICANCKFNCSSRAAPAEWAQEIPHTGARSRRNEKSPPLLEAPDICIIAAGEAIEFARLRRNRSSAGNVKLFSIILVAGAREQAPSSR